MNISIYKTHLTTISMPSVWVARLTPRNPHNGNTSQLPAKPPTLMREITNDVSCFVKGPVENVLFSFSSSSKLIDAQPIKLYFINKI